MAVVSSYGSSIDYYRTARGAADAARQAAPPRTDWSAYQNIAAVHPAKPRVRVKAGSAPSPVTPRTAAVADYGMGGGSSRPKSRRAKDEA